MSPLELAGLITAITGSVTVAARGLTYLWRQRDARTEAAEKLRRTKTDEIDELKRRCANAESEAGYLRKYLTDCQEQLLMTRKER